MLQQTRVAAVLPYYERFLKRFPTVEALAVAGEQEVLAMWAGLGYYSRARNLHWAAKAIAGEGAFPNEYDRIRVLPGIGDYTAAAVASIAFQLPRAALDGNVMRVLSRVTAEPGDIGSGATRKKLQAIAEDWLHPKRPGDFNQALMELGATICLPKSPQCTACPLVRYCEANRLGQATQYPVKLRMTQRSEVAETLFYIENNGTVLLWQRDPGSRRLAGFWELPTASQVGSLTDAPAAGRFRHTIVNTTHHVTVVRASLRTAPRGLKWIPKDRLHELPLSTAAKKAIRCLMKQG